MSLAKLPAVQVTEGVPETPILSEKDNVETTVPPDMTVTVSGENSIVGGVVSGLIVTVSVASAELPAASLAVAVHVSVVCALTLGAVSVLLAKLPPALQVTVGVPTTPTLSEKDKVELALWPVSTVRLAGEKLIVGAVVSATGVPPPPLELPPPPPQA